MKQNILKFIIIAVVFIGLFSCKKDDESATEAYVVPLAEQAPIDNDKLVAFLTTHYYNEEEFDNVASFSAGTFNYDIEFSETAVINGIDIDGDGINEVDFSPAYNRTALINLVETKVITVSGVDHNLYILKERDNDALPTPKFCDSTFMVYKGMNLELTQFDGQVNPIWLDLSQTVKGFSESASELNTATSFTSNGDGTYTYDEFGIGAAFIPSGLGYYAAPPASIGFYAPLIFTFKIMGYIVTDHDHDNVPTYLEDLNGDHILTNDNTDGDTIYNFGDTDDDGDGVLTKYEDLEPDTDPLVDADGDGDPTNDIGDGDPTNDDSDNDGVPNYLDTDSTQSNQD